MNGTSLCLFLFIAAAAFTLLLLIVLSILVQRTDRAKKTVYMLFLKIPKEHLQTLRTRVDDFVNDCAENSSGTGQDLLKETTFTACTPQRKYRL